MRRSARLRIRCNPPRCAGDGCNPRRFGSWYPPRAGPVPADLCKRRPTRRRSRSRRRARCRPLPIRSPTRGGRKARRRPAARRRSHSKGLYAARRSDPAPRHQCPPNAADAPFNEAPCFPQRDVRGIPGDDQLPFTKMYVQCWDGPQGTAPNDISQGLVDIGLQVAAGTDAAPPLDRLGGCPRANRRSAPPASRCLARGAPLGDFRPLRAIGRRHGRPRRCGSSSGRRCA